MSQVYIQGRRQCCLSPAASSWQPGLLTATCVPYHSHKTPGWLEEHGGCRQDPHQYGEGGFREIHLRKFQNLYPKAINIIHDVFISAAEREIHTGDGISLKVFASKCSWIMMHIFKFVFQIWFHCSGDYKGWNQVPGAAPQEGLERIFTKLFLTTMIREQECANCGTRFGDHSSKEQPMGCIAEHHTVPLFQRIKRSRGKRWVRTTWEPTRER